MHLSICTFSAFKQAGFQLCSIFLRGFIFTGPDGNPLALSSKFAHAHRVALDGPAMSIKPCPDNIPTVILRQDARSR